MRSLCVLGFVAVAACGGGGSSVCAGLALADCRLAEGCKVDSCFNCSCAPTIRGCIGATETPAACPDLGCPSLMCCGQQSQCASGTTCVPPGTDVGCGACNSDPSTCEDDADCKAQSATSICEPIRCSCNGNTACTPGCAGDDECADGEACDLATSRCRPKACEAPGDCPANFECVDRACARRTCTDDLACDGYCVEGRCFGSQGECLLPVP